MEHISLEEYGDIRPCEVQMRSDIGGREEQQDSGYAYTDPSVTFSIICDGMGGAACGAQASALAVESMRQMLESYLAGEADCSVTEFLLEAVSELDMRVTHELGKYKSGTTAVAVFIQDQKLFWFSVGDSRLYIFRNGDLVQATRDHNYFLRLREELESGEITPEQFRQESERGEALISFLGIGGLSVYDLTNTPLNLREGDILLLTTDGLYKALPEEMICHILRGAESLSEKADKLMSQINVLKNSIVLDNTTFALIKINARGNPNE